MSKKRRPLTDLDAFLSLEYIIAVRSRALHESYLISFAAPLDNFLLRLGSSSISGVPVQDFAGQPGGPLMTCESGNVGIGD